MTLIESSATSAGSNSFYDKQTKCVSARGDMYEEREEEFFFVKPHI